MENLKVGKIFKDTMSFLWFRIGVYALFFIASIVIVSVIGGIAIGITALFNDSTGIMLIFGFIALAVVLGFIAYARKYVLYLVKAGHVAVITEYMTTGQKPEKANLNYCREVVKSKFAEVSIGAAADSLIEGAVRQIMRWLTKAGELLSFIPGSQMVINVVTTILSTAANYIDEAVLSYIFLKEGNSWQSAKEGIVLYAKSWKELLTTAAKSAVLVWVARIVIFVLGMFILGGIFTAIIPGFGLFLGVIASTIFTVAIEGAIVEPFLTISMIRSYLIAIKDKTPDSELMDKLTSVSSKFNKISEKAIEEINNTVSI